MKSWYIYRADGDPIGPLTTDAVARSLIDGKVGRDAHVAAEGDSEWQQITRVQEIVTATRRLQSGSQPPPPLRSIPPPVASAEAATAPRPQVLVRQRLSALRTQFSSVASPAEASAMPPSQQLEDAPPTLIVPNRGVTLLVTEPDPSIPLAPPAIKAATARPPSAGDAGLSSTLPSAPAFPDVALVANADSAPTSELVVLAASLVVPPAPKVSIVTAEAPKRRKFDPRLTVAIVVAALLALCLAAAVGAIVAYYVLQPGVR